MSLNQLPPPILLVPKTSCMHTKFAPLLGPTGTAASVSNAGATKEILLTAEGASFVAQMFFAIIPHKVMRRLFPTTIAGVAVLLIGASLVFLACF